MRGHCRCAILLICLCFGGGARGSTFQSVGFYQSFDQLVSWATNLQSQNSDIVDLVQFGSTTDGRPLLALKLSTDPTVNDPNKPEFLFTGGMHAREVIGSDAAYNLAQHLVDGYRSGDADCQRILSTREVWIVPDMNPDGRIAVEAGHSEQRKNMHLYAGQVANTYTAGVDLNRNFPHLWSLTTSSVVDETYAGPSVLSEPESSSLWALLHDHGRFNDLLAAIDFHSGSQNILTPWTSPTDFAANPLPVADRQKFDALAAHLQQLTGFSTDRLGYDSYGTLTDSLYEEFHTYAMTEELFGGPFLDYFTYFNPVDQATYNATIDKAIASSMYLLSDAAFTVPEPSSTLVLLILANAALMRRRQRSA